MVLLPLQQIIISTPIISNSLRYYQIPLTTFTNGYTLKVQGWSAVGTAKVWSNTLSFIVE